MVVVFDRWIELVVASFYKLDEKSSLRVVKVHFNETWSWAI